MHLFQVTTDYLLVVTRTPNTRTWLDKPTVDALSICQRHFFGIDLLLLLHGLAAYALNLP